MSKLPFIDTHSRKFDCPTESVWLVLIRILSRSSRVWSLYAKLIACDPLERSDNFSGQVGQTIVGFEVTESELNRKLVLQGRHRFARYKLSFLLQEGILQATTHAAFPGFVSGFYKFFVIKTGAHALVVKAVLCSIVRKAGG